MLFTMQMLTMLVIVRIPIIVLGSGSTSRESGFTRDGSLESIFPCRETPSNVSLPFPWFCHWSPTGIIVEGPNGLMETESLGQFQPNGSFIYGFKIPLENQGPSRVLLHGEEVTKFVAHSEDMNCPRPFSEFDQSYSCSKTELSHLDQYFDWWAPKSISEDILQETILRIENIEVAHVVIIENKIYKKLKPSSKLSREIWDKMFSFLASVARKVQLPNIEFLMHCRDLPIVAWQNIGSHVFGSCGSDWHRDILLPTYQLVDRLLQGDNLRMAVHGEPWETREGKLYFRGSNSGHSMYISNVSRLSFDLRSRAALIAKDRPDLFDVKLRFFQGRSWKKEVVYEAMKMGLGCDGFARNCSESQYRSGKFKYLLNLDGNVAPYRTHMLLMSGGAVVKPKSPYYEYFYKMMIPYQHFVEIRRMANLVKNVEWLRDNDDRVKVVAEKGFRFASNQIQQENIICWTAHALRKVREGLAYEPKLKEGMELVNPGQENCNY